jgi:hypothetical protein
MSGCPDSDPEHFVSPSERYGLIGEKGTFGGRWHRTRLFLDTPTGSWKSAWKQAKKVAKVKADGTIYDTPQCPESRPEGLRWDSTSNLWMDVASGDGQVQPCPE